MLNIDLKLRVVMHTAEMDWQADPVPGVWRKRLVLDKSEQGYATSLVKYEAGTEFFKHEHPGGEEILVLDGVLSDETGEYPSGFYLRNPPGTSHKPFSPDGCEMLVLRNYFAGDDQESVSIDTQNALWLPAEGDMEVMPLFDNANESVSLLKLPVGCHRVRRRNFGGVEWFVLSGCLYDDEGVYPQGSWVRYPDNSLDSMVADEDTVVWCKRGHLAISGASDTADLESEGVHGLI